MVYILGCSRHLQIISKAKLYALFISMYRRHGLPCSDMLGLGYAVCFILCGVILLADIAARAIAPVGAVFCAFDTDHRGRCGESHVGGMVGLGCAPHIHAYLFFFYLGVIALPMGSDRPERGSRPAALLAMVGVINVPIVKFSVDCGIHCISQPAYFVAVASH